MPYYLKRRKLPEDLDYQAVGLMSGVEIHQQLYTAKKMFCHCPSRRYSEEFHTRVLRHMRPTLSEMGEYDGTALMEFKKKKEIVYLVNKNSTCTYELDDTPPFLVNEEGLDIAIEIALLLNCSIVDELHITRKQYLDGSIPTGFQRTAIVGVEGWVPVDGKRIGIIQLGYEEDSCREVSDERHTITFRPDRLGMPLIEVVTYPDMHHPIEVARVVEVLGRLLRVTGKVRRGIGSVRQDVNVSVRGGTRIEIKGVPRIAYIPMLVHIEALRQVQLLALRDELHRRGFTEPDRLLGESADVTDLFARTSQPVLARALARGDRIVGLVVRGVSGLAEFPTQPERIFQDELKGRVRVVACLDEKPYLMSTIDFADHGLTQDEIDALHRRLGVTDRDVAFLVWGNERDSKLGADEILLRWREAVQGVPSETRQHFPDGHTDFERILPGPERMYPDTDHPPREIERSRIERIRAHLPSPPWERERFLSGLGLPDDVVYHLAISPRYHLFRRIVAELPAVSPVFAGVVLHRVLKALSRKGVRVDAVSDDALFEIFRLFAEGRIVREAVPKLIEAMADSPAASPAEVAAAAGLEPVGEDTAGKVLAAAVEEASKRSFAAPDKRFRFVMGRAMHELRGRFPGDELSRLASSAV